MRALLAGVLVFSLPVAADPAPDVTKMAADDCARAHKLGKTCILTITDDGPIDGRVPLATDRPITGLPTGKRESLVRIRTHFIPEILKTAEDL